VACVLGGDTIIYALRVGVGIIEISSVPQSVEQFLEPPAIVPVFGDLDDDFRKLFSLIVEMHPMDCGVEAEDCTVVEGDRIDGGFFGLRS
jgi:hypothetical protein